MQDWLRREGDQIARQVLKEGGHVFVCGDCTMAEDVYQTLKSIVQDKGDMNDAEVENYMLSLRVTFFIHIWKARKLVLINT